MAIDEKITFLMEMPWEGSYFFQMHNMEKITERNFFRMGKSNVKWSEENYFYAKYLFLF